MNSSSSFHFHLFIFGFALVFLYPTGAATCHPDDEAGLLGFKSSVTYDPSGMLSSWKKGIDCCSSWSNTLCDGGRVTSLFIDPDYSQGLTISGTFSPSLAKLQHLERISLTNFRNVTGSFPQFFFQFRNLYLLNIQNNRLSGPLPANIGKLSQLQELYLGGNRFTGPIPSSLSKIHGLRELDLGGNLLTGTIPLGFSKLKIVSFMNLSDNHLSGSPSKFLKESYQLREFQASGNKLRFDMGKLSFSKRLQWLDLSRNLVFGKVPAKVAGLKILNLSQNHLCGKLPVTKFPASAFAGNDCLCGSPLAPCKL